MKALSVKNNTSVALEDIPLLPYPDFFESIVEALSDTNVHCANYFAYEKENGLLQVFACLADDAQGDIKVLSCEVEKGAELPAISEKIHAMERFERELSENYGIVYQGHPWMKPVRYAHERADQSQVMDNYPFYQMEGENLHEVGVGPIHAGIIEPGHFRFICDGEKVLHLEIHLGYQHRGVEKLMIEKTKLIQRSLLAESVAGDTAVGHGTAFAHVWESLCGVEVSARTQLERCLAAEIERIAIHTGDLSALCGDVAYQLGNAVFGRLRTPIINFMQEWCGNRLGKGCIRPGHSPYAFTPALADRLQEVLKHYERDYLEMIAKTVTTPSVLSRFERTGVLSLEQAREIGAVGMAARHPQHAPLLGLSLLASRKHHASSWRCVFPHADSSLRNRAIHGLCPSIGATAQEHAARRQCPPGNEASSQSFLHLAHRRLARRNLPLRHHRPRRQLGLLQNKRSIFPQLDGTGLGCQRKRNFGLPHLQQEFQSFLLWSRLVNHCCYVRKHQNIIASGQTVYSRCHQGESTGHFPRTSYYF